jgi:hypothetical protein
LATARLCAALGHDFFALASHIGGSVSQNERNRMMQSVIYAATRNGYRVQVMDGAAAVHEYSAGNCWQESQTTVAPRSLNAVRLSQLRRWARQTASEIAKERGIPIAQVQHGPDLEAQLEEEEADFVALRSHHSGSVCQKGTKPCESENGCGS